MEFIVTTVHNLILNINGVGTIFINVYYALYINIFFMMIIELSLIIVWF